MSMWLKVPFLFNIYRCCLKFEVVHVLSQPGEREIIGLSRCSKTFYTRLFGGRPSKNDL